MRTPSSTCRMISMSIDEQALERSIHQLTAELGPGLNGAGLSAGLSRLVSAAAEVLHVDCVGLLMLDDADQIRTVAATGDGAAALEAAQEDLGVGPGIDTITGRHTVAVADLAARPEYAALWRRVAGRGVRAVLSAPIWVSGAQVGNLNAVTPERHDWTQPEIHAGEAFASMVGQLLHLGALAGTRTVTEADLERTDPRIPVLDVADLERNA
jgi:GAF domain-containing protein